MLYLAKKSKLGGKYSLAPNLSPSIRITTKCTQQCAHCCFLCSPKQDTMMTVEKAMMIVEFLKANKILRANLLGGEFFCNPNWFEILTILCKVINEAVLVTNGDWALDPLVAKFVISFAKQNPNVSFLLTYDQWHNTKSFNSAMFLLLKNRIDYTLKNNEQDTIVPAGRIRLTHPEVDCSIYCQQPEKQIRFLINEAGELFKCCFGFWPIGTIEKFQTGGFKSRLEQFNFLFYNTGIKTCKQCIDLYFEKLKSRQSSW